jgi:hypothetical protein
VFVVYGLVFGQPFERIERIEPFEHLYPLNQRSVLNLSPVSSKQKNGSNQ